ncbi:hypothetical protein MF672_008150 [Actinomadura sp. ATCC 31491]|uniref:Winged helix DNA-binding domain-containing protein n=1 Tax=Actinomadura luzonensis TaxID=2805427 RepID=A0ABT0FN28_9ACTN|nr:hypothetical protein [Actinomadura luzonensis]MCK2213758.1 hypothetical protein [Actinomadura luzonensis]
MNGASAEAILYAQARALEHAAALPGMRPLRIHALAFPLHAAELSATIEERGPFDLLDRYVGLAIAEGGFTRLVDIAAFLGVTEHMVDRVLRFLGGIGHLEGTAEALSLTERGLRAVRDDRRYTEKQERLRLYFDGVRCEPLRTAHYARGVRVLDREAAYAQRTFRLLPETCGFRPGAVEELARRPDRSAYDLPDELLGLAVLEVGRAFLPCYAIRAHDGRRLRTLVYSGVAELRDRHLEEIIESWPTAANVMESADSEQPRDHFAEWMRERDIRPRALSWIDHHSVRLVLPPSRYSGARDKGAFSLAMLGSYVAPRGHVLQLWCDDAATRARAVLDRALAYATATRRTVAEVAEFLDRVCRQLEPGTAVTVDDLRRHARQAGYGALDLAE